MSANPDDLDPTQYSQQLGAALTAQNPVDPQSQPQLGPVAPPAGAALSGGMMKGTMTTRTEPLPPAGKQSAPSMPPNFTPKFDNDKLKEAKTLPDLVEAMQPDSKNKYMDWWEKEYGSVNQHYDQIANDIGHRPDSNRPLSRDEKFQMVLDFGLNLLRNSQGSQYGQDTGGAIAGAIGASVQNQMVRRQNEPIQNRLDSDTNEANRQGALKNIGTRGNALVQQSNLDTADLTRAHTAESINRDMNSENDVVGTLETSSGIMGRTKSGALSPFIDPRTGRIAQPNPGAGREETTYHQQHTDLVNHYLHAGMSQAEADSHATQDLNLDKGRAHKSLREVAEARVDNDLKGSADWAGEDNITHVPIAQRLKVKSSLMENERLAAIKDRFGTDAKRKPNMKPAPLAAELDLKNEPSKAGEFLSKFGYLPDGFWPEK